MKTEIVLKARGSTVVQLQSHAFQEVSSQEIFLFKPSAIHEPHFWNEPTKPSQLHSFNKTPTAVCPGSNRLYSSSDFVHDVTKERKFQMIPHQESSSSSLSKEFGYIFLNFFLLVFSLINQSQHLVVCFCGRLVLGDLAGWRSDSICQWTRKVCALTKLCDKYAF